MAQSTEQSTSPATSSSLRIGIDVGGTNTDAVILDASLSNAPNRGVLAWYKTPTTNPHVTDGIETAIRAVLEKAEVSTNSIGCLIIGTTHFINAVVEHDARRLAPVAIIRLSKSFAREIPPCVDWPSALKNIVYGYHGFVDGGLHIHGEQEAPIVQEQIVWECQKIKKMGIRSIVVNGIFSPIDEEFKQEDRVKEIILREIPDADIVCSHEVANIGFLERENAAILNASILKFARRIAGSFRAAMKRLNLTCPLYLTQNDGTLFDADSAAKLPIRTFCSGPTNSMRGAAYLGLKGKSSETSTIVADIGGTTTDVGVLLPSGFPRQASAYVKIAGVRVNYGLPHLESIGLGGGSKIRQTSSGVTVGPDSVGYALDPEACVFGGSILTTTDIAVAAGTAEIGNAELIRGKLDESLLSETRSKIATMLSDVIDLMKTSPEPLPVILVGGGSVVAPDKLEGVSEVIRPPFHDVANAVGAAIANVGATVDLIQDTSHQTQVQAIEHAKQVAIQRAIAAGAQADTVSIATVNAMPVQYAANKLRTIVRAVGELSAAQSFSAPANTSLHDEIDGDFVEEAKAEHEELKEDAAVDVKVYKPLVRPNADGIQEWIVSETDLEWIAAGCYVLGCAGGGNPAAELFQLKDHVRQGHKLRVIDQFSLKDDALIYWGGHMGSPAVSVERLAANETVDAFHELMEYLHHDRIDAVMGLEIGGGNGMQPLLCGSSKFFDCPIIDADWMGRAYPTYWQTTLAVHEPGQLTPCAIASGDGKNIIMTKTTNDEIVDRALRASCSEMGSRVGMAAKPTTTDRVRRFGVLNTMSLAWRIGRCIARAGAENSLSKVPERIIDEIGGLKTARILFRGKITAVESRLYKGHSHGQIVITQLPADEAESSAEDAMPAVAQGGTLTIPYKNENIYAKHVAEDGTESYIAMVPDLIAVLDMQTGRALGVPEYRYGLRVTVLGITGSPRWTDTQAGLDIGGPKAFGYDLNYKPLGIYVEPRSVVEEFATVAA